MTVVVVKVARELGPPQGVVGQDGALEPGAVGKEADRGTVLHSRALFQVAYVELSLCPLAMEGVDLDGGCGEVGVVKAKRSDDLEASSSSARSVVREIAPG